MRVLLSDEAERDLEEIGDYIALENPRRALTFVGELRSACAELADMPERFQMVERYERQKIRRRPYGQYLIFYPVTPDVVLVLTIMHSSRDHSALLPS